VVSNMTYRSYRTHKSYTPAEGPGGEVQ